MFLPGFLLCRGRGEQGKIGARNTGIKRTGGAREAEEERAGVRSYKRVGSEKRRGKLGKYFANEEGHKGASQHRQMSFWHLRRFVDNLPGSILCNKTLFLGKNRTYNNCIHHLVGKDRGWVGARENSRR